VISFDPLPLLLGLWFMVQVGTVHVRHDPWRIDAWWLILLGTLGIAVMFSPSPWAVFPLWDGAVAFLWIVALRKRGGPPGGAA